MGLPWPRRGQLKDPWLGHPTRFLTEGALGGSWQSVSVPRFPRPFLHPIFRACGFDVFGFLLSRQVPRVQRHVTLLDLWALLESSQGREGAAGPSPGEGLGPLLQVGGWDPKPASCSPHSAEPGREQRHLHWAPPSSQDPR